MGALLMNIKRAHIVDCAHVLREGLYGVLYHSVGMATFPNVHVIMGA